MDRFSGARHSAYTLRRFYPAMYGRNLTFMPSQYGADDDKKGSTQREKSAAETVAEAGTVLALRYGQKALEGKFADAEIAREGLRQKYASEAEARLVSAQALAKQMDQKPFNPVPWVVGGLGVVAAGGIAYYLIAKRKA